MRLSASVTHCQVQIIGVVCMFLQQLFCSPGEDSCGGNCSWEGEAVYCVQSL